MFAAADASILSSSWENFPHSVVESLAVGTPVIATRVGGVAEVVEDGVNGLLVPVGDADALAAAVRRFFADEELRERLRAQRGGLGVRLSPRAPPRRRSSRQLQSVGAMRPRVLFVARTRYALPLNETLQRRFDALSAVMDWHQLGTAADGESVSDDRFTLVRPLSGRVARRRRVLRRPAGAGRPRDPVVPARRRHRPGRAGHGARARAAERSRGSTCRSSSTSTATGVATRASSARPPGGCSAPRSTGLPTTRVRHADGVRTVSGFTSGLVRERGVEPTATFPAYMDLAPFLATVAAAASRRRRARCSSASSSGTRRSTCWRRRGGASRRGVPARRAADRRHGPARGHRRGARRRARASGQLDAPARDGRGGARARRGDAARASLPRRGHGPGRSSRRSAGPAPSSEPTRAGSPISSSTTSAGCSCRRTTPARSPRRSSEC